jgi:glycosyltransferase involved in cell wall biosynthesis
MKILHTAELYDPSKGGSQEVVKQLSEHMVMAGHDVTVATTKFAERKQKKINGVQIEEFDIHGNILTGYEGEIEIYKEYLLHNKFDVVMNYAAQNWTSDIFFEVMEGVDASAKVFVPCGFSHLYTPQCKDYFAKMPDILKSYDATVYLANHYRDVDFAREHGVKNIHIIPNGADEREFGVKVEYDVLVDLKLKPNTKIIYQGGTSFTTLKGQLDAIAIFQQANITDAVLLLNGNIIDGTYTKLCEKAMRRHNINPLNKVRNKLIRIRHWDREKTVAGFQQADIFLFPSNIEASPIVLYEACASRTPFLSTNVGNAGEIVEWTGGGSLLPTEIDSHGYSHAIIDKSAVQLEELITNPNKAKQMADRGYDAWRQKFSWQKITSKYINLYEELLDNDSN